MAILLESLKVDDKGTWVEVRMLGGVCCATSLRFLGLDYPEPRVNDEELYTFYNILWAECQDVIAYRKGVGRVKKDTWKGLDSQDIDLVLG